MNNKIAFVLPFGLAVSILVITTSLAQVPRTPAGELLSRSDNNANSAESIPPRFVVLAPDELLSGQTFWDNRDWQWYKQSIPFFDCPDKQLTTTYYYRWELLTKHLVYGSPKDGYTFTEFIDRPFWSGKYGAISCPAGHQLYEARWLRSPRVGFDFARYWFRTAGAQPRRYSCWIADAVGALNSVHPCQAFVQDLLPDLVKNYQAWEDKHFVAGAGMFWQNGHDDGMEYNINSRQTQDILRGAPGFRPTLNSYMWADAKAIANVARQAGQADFADKFEQKAADLKRHLQSSLWDSKRQFFLHRNMNRESRDGFDVAAGSLIYESGKYAGSEHGREEIGYVPWQFNLPDDGAGYEAAWKFLMDENYFAAKFGPRTVELNDPQYYLSPSCCWWSGHSWPYATAQTLKAMANLLQNYQQNFVTRRDYVSLMSTFANSHRKNELPYIAEACHPDTGSWDGHDGFNHSEHYFHSSFIDLVLTGAIGIRTQNETQLSIDPLADSWDYFAVDNLRFRGHDLSIVWDKTGQHYNQGDGFRIFVDGNQIHHSTALQRVDLDLAAVPTQAHRASRVNLAVNNSLKEFPRLTASSTAAATSTLKAIDGNYWYHPSPPNRWTSALSKESNHWLELDFGVSRKFDTIALYWLDDELPSLVGKPLGVRLDVYQGNQWKSLAPYEITKSPVGHTASRYTFAAVTASRVRLTIAGQSEKQVGLTEFEVWGPADQDLSSPIVPSGNIAAAREDHEFPKAAASFTSPFDTAGEAIDGLVNFAAEPRNRWTSYQSPATEDWLEVDFGKVESFDRAEIGFYDDGGGVQLPKSFKLEVLSNGSWLTIDVKTQKPETINGTQMTEVEFARVAANKIRIILQHRGRARSGLTELRVFND